MDKTVYFKTNTLLKNLIGKDLINDDNIAIIELVKNSYDAQSEIVTVKFTHFSPSKKNSTNLSQIIVMDEGDGMSLTDIEDKWLNIAYSEKKLLAQESGAYLAGNKGVGRFSCDRLGEQLHLLSRKKGDDIFHLHIQWSDFETEGKKNLTIQQIPLVIQTINDEQAAKFVDLKKFPKHGTILVISNLRSKWGKDRLRNGN